MFRSCTAISVASAHLTARLARHRKCQDLRLKWDFGSLRAVSATFAVQRLRGERQAKFRGIETGLGKNRSASAGRFFVAQQAHVRAFRLGCLIAVRKFGGVLCRRKYCVRLRGGHCLLRLGARGYAELNKKIERVPVLLVSVWLRWVHPRRLLRPAGSTSTEQSTVFLGTASAGSAAGGSLGSMFWNPAATAQFSGLNSESSYTLVLPYANIDIKSSPAGSGSSGNIGIDAHDERELRRLPGFPGCVARYGDQFAVRLGDETGQLTYPGSFLGVTTKLLTVNANPTIAYRIAPGITIGAGVQMEWAQAKLQFRDPSLRRLRNSAAMTGRSVAPLVLRWSREMVRPSASVIALNLPTISRAPSTRPLPTPRRRLANFPATTTLNLPDIVTLSSRQVMTPTTRLMGTVEWTNWSRFKDLPMTVDGTRLDGPVELERRLASSRSAVNTTILRF